MNKHTMIPLVIAAEAVVAAGTVTATMAAQEEGTAKTVGKNRKFMDYEDGVFKVKAGAGAPTEPLTAFFPQVANIKVGESVVLHNTSNVGERQAVTFVLDNLYWANFEAA